MKSNKLPKVSLILLTLNGGKGVEDILQSIRRQKYPKELVEIIVVDDGSTDDSVAIATKYKAIVIKSPHKGLYRNWIIGLHKVTGEFVYYVEQDIQLRGTDFFQKMLKPLLEDKRFIASFTRESYPHPDQSWAAQFLSYHPSQCDPLYEFITPRLEDTYVEEKEGYITCKFTINKLPPFARMFYRMSYLKKTSNWKVKDYFDHDFMIQNIKAGYTLFAYVPDAGIFHFHARNLMHLLKKRARNLDIHYFPYNKETEYKWVDVNDRKSIIKLGLWVVYANLFFPELIRGIYRSIKNKSAILLLQPIMAVTITDVVLWKFITSKVGRGLIINANKTMFLNKM